MAARLERLLMALVAVGVAVVVASVTAVAFTGTPAALRLVRRERAVYRRVRAVRNVETGAIVYCPSGPEGWTYAPAPHCKTPARVVEKYQLSGGHVMRVVGKVTARGLPTLRYVLSKKGWYSTAAGFDCWVRSDLPFVAPLFVDFPFPKEHLTISGQSRSTIVLVASAAATYREVDYIARRSLLIRKVIAISRARGKSYRVIEHFNVLRKPIGAAQTPVCGPGGPHPLP